MAALAALAAALLLLAAPGAAKLGKPRGLFWGAWIGPQLTGTQPPWDMSAIDNFAAMVGKDLSTIEFAAPFADCSVTPCSFYSFPDKEMTSIRNYGAVPFLSWSSQSTPSMVNEPDFQLSDVIAGTYDSYIREFASGARDWGHPFFLRFNWEPNGNWFPWSEGVNGNKRGEYIIAWQHVHDLFTEVGANNVTWVWCPYIDLKKYGVIASFYPGDEYVDWTCLDGYNWAKAQGRVATWKSFEQIFAGSYHQVTKKIAPRKPMVLAEIASSGGGPLKAEWIRGMFKSVHEKFPRVRGLIWFNQVQQGVSWPLENSLEATDAFAWGLRRHPYRSNQYGALATSPIPPPR